MRRMILALVLPALLISTVFVLGQSNTPPNPEPPLEITVGHTSCSLALAQSAAATPEATAVSQVAGTPEATVVQYPVLALGNDCADVVALLHVPSNDTLWIMFSAPNEAVWQKFQKVDGDPYPPQIDRRGRFIGCSIPERGEQTCRVLWQNGGATYELDIPITVRGIYTAPPPTAAPISTPVPTQNSGIWGSCGSCTTCGGPVEQCVLSPDNVCLWDAATCEHPKHPGT